MICNAFLENNRYKKYLILIIQFFLLLDKITTSIQTYVGTKVHNIILTHVYLPA